jgi:hypothetical protein
MKKSAAVRLTAVAAIGLAARGQPRPDPCAAATFTEAACRAAVENRGYCWNGRWVKLRYSYPYPYYFDSYVAYIANGGIVDPAAVGTCGPAHGWFSGAHSVSRGGFGSSACYAGHG